MKTSKIKSKKDYILYGYMMFSSTMSYLSIGGFKIWYIALLLCVLYFIYKKSISVPKTIFFFFIFDILIASLLSSFEFGITRDFFNLILGVALVCISYTFATSLDRVRMEEILKKVAVLNAICVAINTITQIEGIILYLKFDYLDHPNINTLSVGGTNIDATWLSIYCAAFYNSKHKWTYMLYSILINTLYAARVGYLINAFLILVFLYQDRKKIYKIWTKLIFLMPIALTFFSYTGSLEKAIARFSNLGQASDEGGMHRILMWISAPDVIINYPYGVGMGNSIAALDKVTGKIFRDGNFHNLVLEYFVSAGLIGGILYVIMIVAFFCYAIRNKNNLDTITLMLASYIVAGFVQFSGDESIMFLLVGAFLGMRRTRYLKIKNIGKITDGGIVCEKNGSFC